MLWFPHEPQLCKPWYISRCVLVRLVLVWCSCWSLDAVVKAQGRCHCTTGCSSGGGSASTCCPWDWRQRAGLAGVQLQLVLSLFGVVWPYLHMWSYERHHGTYQEVLAWGSIAGKVLELVSGVTGDVLGRSSEAAMMLHTILFAAQQYAAYPRHLAGMLAAYSACHALGGRQSLLAVALASGELQHDSAAAAATQPSSGSSSVAGAIVNASESYMTMYMTGLVLFNLITWYAPSPEQAPTGRWQTSSHHSTSHSHQSRPSWRSAAMSSTRSSLAEGVGQGPRQALGVPGGDAQSSNVKRASNAYVLKFAGVRSVDALFLGLLAVLMISSSSQSSVALQTNSSSSSVQGVMQGSVSGLQEWTGVVAGVLAAAQLFHGVVCFLLPGLLLGRGMVLDGLLLHASALGKMWLVAHSPLLGHQQAFPMLVVLGTLLAAHEQPRRLFGGQLALFAAGMRYVHMLRLATAVTSSSSDPHLSPGAAASFKAWLPEYAFITLYMTCVYSCVCLGKYQTPPDPSLQAQGRSTRRSSSSRFTASSSQANNEPLRSPKGAAHTTDVVPGAARRSFQLNNSAYARLHVDVGEAAQEQPFSAAAAARATAGAAAAAAAQAASTTQQQQQQQQDPGSPPSLPPSPAGRSGRNRTTRRSILWASSVAIPEDFALGEQQEAVGRGNAAGSATADGASILAAGAASSVTTPLLPSSQPSTPRGSRSHQTSVMELPSAHLLQRSLSRSRSRSASTAGGLDVHRSSSAGAPGAEGMAGIGGFEQQVACDVLLSLLGLVGSSTMGSRLLTAAWHSRVAHGTLLTLLAITMTVIHMSTSLPYLVYLWLKPHDALARREVLWSIRMTVSPLSHEAARLLLGLPSLVSLHSSVVAVAGFMGATHMSVATFARWLPLMVAFHFWSHVRSQWSEMSWTRLAIEGMEFNLSPVVAYALIHIGGGWVQTQALRLVPLLMKQARIKRGSKHYHIAGVAAGVWLQVSVGVTMLVLVVGRTAGAGQRQEAFAFMDKPKEALVNTIEALLQPERFGDSVAAAGVLWCLCAVPAIHGLVAWLVCRSRGNKASGQPTRGSASNSPLMSSGGQPLLDKMELAAQQRMGMDRLSALASVPILPLLATRALLAVVIPAEGVLLWHRAVALATVAAATPGLLGRVYVVERYPVAAQKHRDLLWCAGQGLGTGLVQLGNLLVKAEPLWAPSIEILLSASVWGLLEVTYPWFAALALPFSAAIYFGAHVAINGSQMPWSVMAADALEFTINPSIVYGLTRAVFPILNKTLVAYALTKANQWGYIKSPEQHKSWAVWSAMGALGVVAVLPVWCIALGVRLPGALDPIDAMAGIKGEVIQMFSRMDLGIAEQTDTLRTLLAMAGVGVCFLAVSGLQALLLNNPAFRNPRQCWYEACKARVMALGDTTLRCLSRQTAATGPQHLRDALLVSLQEVLQGCFPGCTVMVVLMEDKGSLYRGMARRYLLQASPEAAEMPASDLLALGELPSVEQACQHGQIVYDSNVRPGTTGYGDWEALAADYGMDGFLTAPLSCAEAAMGALVLAASTPVSIDRYLRRLAGDVAQSLSQTLYTLSCIEQMRAGEQIINDILPEKVAEELRRRLFSGDPNQQDSAAPPTPWGAPSPAHHRHLPPTTPHPRRVTEVPSLSGRSMRMSNLGGMLDERPCTQNSPSFGEVPLVYKQWHPAVSVLFADISSYTAMSTQVEPEQVMMLLHELFSKYDNLCSQYGVYKVETIGDCYMACCGLLTEDPDHAANMVQFGQAMLRAASTVRSPLGGSVHIRVGLHSGRVMSGIVGSIRARYCLFGDTVNTASRMESTGVVDRIQVSQDTYQLLGHLQDDFELRTDVSVKGKGVMQTYVLREDLAVEQCGE